MGTFTYLCGRPCSGKSTVAVGIQTAVRGIQYVRGDDYWNIYPGLAFSERVAATNQSIRVAVRNSGAQDIVCEWVPCQGQFVTDLYEISVATKREFLQVLLTAPLDVLKKRKVERDGDEELSPEVLPSPPQNRLYRSLRFDTDRVDAAFIAGEVCKWIQLQQQS